MSALLTGVVISSFLFIFDDRIATSWFQLHFQETPSIDSKQDACMCEPPLARCTKINDKCDSQVAETFCDVMVDHYVVDKPKRR